MKALRTMKGRLHDITIKEHRNKRSDDANAYAWTLIGQLADAMRLPPNDIYRQAIMNIGGNYEILPIKDEAVSKFKDVWQARGIGWMVIDMGKSKHEGYRNLRVYYGSSAYDTRQMSQLIDVLIQDCLALGIETKTQEELDSIMAAWSEKEKR